METKFQVTDGNFEQCMKCSICTAYCPVTLVNQNFPGPKQSGPDGERYRLKDIKYFDKTLEYCINCKRCEVACPSDVKIADIIQVVRFKHASSKPGLRNRLLAMTDTVGRLSSALSFAVNPMLRNKPFKRALDITLGIDYDRQLPQYASTTFSRWYNKRERDEQEKYPNKVSYFHGCFVNYNNPDLGKDLIKVFNAVGYGVELFDEKCCGMPLIMNGLVKEASANARYNIKQITNEINKGRTIVTTSTTCTLTMRDEYNHILGLDNNDIRDSIFLATRFLYDLVEDRKIKLVFKDIPKLTIAYHTSCHMEKLGWAIYSSKLLALIPNTKTIVIDSSCCGLAGTHGYKKENFNDSQKIGAPLFKTLEKVNPDIVASDCESCKRQIEMSTRFKVSNPITIIAESLDIEATRKANNLT